MMLGMGLSELLIVMVIYLLSVVPVVLLVALLVLAIRHFLREERLSRDPERVAARKTLAEVIAEHRKAANMTQEFVAHELGVSRQAVSKWESGASEPSTTNLMALAHFFGMEPADLLREVSK